MFKFIGGLVVYGFAICGLATYLRERNGTWDDASG